MLFHLIATVLLLNLLSCLPIDDKLDFGKPPAGNTSSPSNSDLSNPKLSVTNWSSCGSSLCSNYSNGNNSIQTEIVVQVRTNVHLDQSKVKTVAENTAADIPIVVGSKGTFMDKRYDFPQFTLRDNRNFQLTTPSISPFPNTQTDYDMRRDFNYGNSFFNYPKQHHSALPSQQNRNRINTIALPTPYFDTTFNSHHFGEEPPPRMVHIPKTGAFNPVAFRNIPRNQWKPSSWNNRDNKYAFNYRGSNINPAFDYDYKNREVTGCKCSCERCDSPSNSGGSGLFQEDNYHQ